jgi:hypothetical protein
VCWYMVLLCSMHNSHKNTTNRLRKYASPASSSTRLFLTERVACAAFASLLLLRTVAARAAATAADADAATTGMRAYSMAGEPATAAAPLLSA